MIYFKIQPGFQKTARRATKGPLTGKPKLSRVISGYGGLMIPLSQIRLTPKMGVIWVKRKKIQIFRPKMGPVGCPVANNGVNTKTLSFWSAVMMVTKFLDDFPKN